MSLPSPSFPPLPTPTSPPTSASPPPTSPPTSNNSPSATSPTATDLPTLDPEYAAEPPACYLPDGTPLALTYDRREMFLTAFPEDHLYPDSPAACSFLLFLASHPRTVWNAPTPDPEDPAGLLLPLHSRPDAFRDFVDAWKARTLTCFNSPSGVLRCQTLARRLWTGQHANQPILPDSSSEKKNPPLQPSPPAGNSAPSLPVTIPSAPATSIITPPSGISTSSSTATSSAADSIPPPPPSTAPASPPSSPASMPPSLCDDCDQPFPPAELTRGICLYCDNQNR